MLKSSQYIPLAVGVLDRIVRPRILGISKGLLLVYNCGHGSDDADFEWWAWYGRQPIIRFWYRRIARYIKEMVGNPQSVLSLGCGCSPLLGTFQSRVVGVDINPGKLVFLKTKLPNIEVICADITTMDPVGKFECVVCSEVLEYVHPSKLLKVVNLVVDSVVDGGKVVVAFPNYESKLGKFMETLLHGHVHFDLKLGQLDTLFGGFGFGGGSDPRCLFWDTVCTYRKVNEQ